MERTKNRVRAHLPHPIASEKSAPPANGTASSTAPLHGLRSIASEAHVPIAVNDFVAYEYIDAEQRWQWGLATVAALPAPRLAQLLPWTTEDRASLAEMPPPISPEDRKRIAARLEDIRRKRSQVRDEDLAVRRRLAVRHAVYSAGRRKVSEAAELAEQTLNEARRHVGEIEACDWREIRSYRTPPPIVVLVMEAVLTVLGYRPASWGQMQMYIRANGFVRRVAEFDPVKLSDETKKSIHMRFLENPKFTYADAINGSQALGYLQQWVVAQIATASAAEGLMEYDIAHAKERAAISGLEQQIHAFQRALQEFTNEEERLRAVIGEGADLVIGHKSGSVPTPRQQAQEIKEQQRLSSSNANASNNNFHYRNNKGRYSHLMNDHSTASAPVSPSTVAGANIASVEYIHSTGAVWTFADDPIIVLRSSILCNYDQPESTVVRLTPAQIAQIELALRHRRGEYEDEQRAAASRQKLQDALEDLRGQHGHALQRLQDLESGTHDLQRALEDRERELTRLNEFIVESGIPTKRLRNPRAAVGQLDPADSAAHTEVSVNEHSSGTAHSEKEKEKENEKNENGNEENEEEEDLELRVADLESRLTRALHENPTAAQVQLLEDDLCAAQDELRRTKNELDNFRAAQAPSYFTSTAFRADRDANPAVCLEDVPGVAQKEIKLQNEPKEPKELCDDSAAERLNAELRAHEATRRALEAATCELSALRAQYSDAANGRTAEGPLAGACAALEGGEGRGERAAALRGVMESLREEAQRQRAEAAAVSRVLEEARELLGAGD